MSPRDRIAAWGFVPERLTFTLRTALAGCLALLVAWLLGLEHPQWAAMTVFSAAQPVRNLLVEKSFFRLVGTIAGTLVGMLLVAAAEDRPALLVAGLAVWIGACAGLGNVLRGFVAYGTILAGYSASMVALLETAHPGHLLALGTDRALTVLTGVATGLVVGLLFTQKASESEIAANTRRLAARILADMAAFLRGAPPPSTDDWHDRLAEMALLDEGLDPHGAGSLASRRSARRLRVVLAAQVTALLWLKTERSAPHEPALADALERAARSLEHPGAVSQTVAALEEAARLAGRHPALLEVLQGQAAALREWAETDEAAVAGSAAAARGEPVLPAVVLHRDWIGARHAALRAGGVMLLVGLAWVVTGWAAGPYVLLGTSVMISLFSTFENPAAVMRQVLAGQFFGACAALACRWLVWPFATSELGLVLSVMPFIISGVVPMSHRRTMLGGTDYVMVLLLLSQPAYPLSGSFLGSLAIAAAVVAGPAIALLAYGLVFPTDARRRLETLITMMVRDLQDAAASPDSTRHRGVLRARLQHRLLRLVRLAQAAGERRFSPTEGGLAVYVLGRATLLLHERASDPALSAGTHRALQLALRRIRHLADRPERVPPALARAAARLDADAAGEGGLLRAAGESMARNPAFFDRSARRRA
ncbi:FUSC family protein [Mycoplana dimorpha]|uniref:Putative membrane protein YccC n=1 Tax=Mycoplana dimorpha TaxID=28320 RepID=A0A2T5B3D8_MYCDI|nr:FUSC family protein [Mycoplana dimorpha]PTM93480.1 putative membrane protein YccC [Mycoplana dimorpha]